MKNNSALRCLCEGAIMLALAQILSWLKLYELPQGGSITLAMLPIIFFAVRWGAKRGFLVSFAFGLLQLLLDGAYAWTWQSMIGDYIVAFGLLGAAGFFKGTRAALYTGTVAAVLLRFIAHWVTGATVWAEYMPERFFGLTMTSPWFYSALYNGSFLAVDAALCIIVFAIISKPLKPYITGQK